MKFRPRGFLLVFALLLTVFIAVIALGLLGAKQGNYATSKAVLDAVQARALARSGLDDIWVKLGKDPSFPSGIGDAQKVFSYSEEMLDASDNVVGSYRVTVDRTYLDTHEIIVVESTGTAGIDISSATRFTIYAELDVRPGTFAFKVREEGSAPRL